MVILRRFCRSRTAANLDPCGNLRFSFLKQIPSMFVFGLIDGGRGLNSSLDTMAIVTITFSIDFDHVLAGFNSPVRVCFDNLRWYCADAPDKLFCNSDSPHTEIRLVHQDGKADRPGLRAACAPVCRRADGVNVDRSDVATHARRLARDQRSEHPDRRGVLL